MYPPVPLWCLEFIQDEQQCIKDSKNGIFTDQRAESPALKRDDEPFGGWQAAGRGGAGRDAEYHGPRPTDGGHDTSGIRFPESGLNHDD
jgi:hypothetical protein